MEIFFIRALQLIMSLSLLVLIHEFGHFIFSKLFKVRVEKFYLFFDWGISLFMIPSKNSNSNDKALIKLPATKSETEYGVGWIPLGGYCKISGMIDESMDTEQMQQPAQPYEFRSKPAWQRLLIMVGGVMFNLILAFFIYSMVLFTWGENYWDMHKATYGMEYNQVAESMGFVDGDIMLKVDGEDVRLTPVEYKILELLARNRGHVFSADEIYSNVWNEQTVVGDNTIAVHVRHIREKIEINPKDPKYLKVVWGIGYKID